MYTNVNDITTKRIGKIPGIYPLNKKTNRHLTNDSLTSDAYDNFPDKNGYDNYPIIRKTTTSQNDSEGNSQLYLEKVKNLLFV